ncbi:hypothetical protein CHL78_008665 [Romboutsia weinsteinii]|uniref:Molecular chaperone DnaJ n=1 Tax=Romboutsia weinsteinii TaxID=2020949 RepID=A0A371J4B6_9FIRM|nr:hypothetical protein [Romboutsia weinsteinii]RDY27528.1 hypothetical protein CHL78_008665 [Romboutsia weinsteinii]
MESTIRDYDSLLTLYIDLIRKREDVIYKKQPYLESKYVLLFSELMQEELVLTINIKKLKRKIQVYLSDLKTNVDFENEKTINREISILKEQVIYLDELVRISEINMNIESLNIEEKENLKILFKNLIRILHPDLVTKSSENKRKLWEKARDAYNTNNIQIIRILSDTLAMKENKGIREYNQEDLEQKITEISNEIKEAKLGFPFNIEKDMEDMNWIEESREEIRERIDKLKDDEKKLINFMSGLS